MLNGSCPNAPASRSGYGMRLSYGSTFPISAFGTWGASGSGIPNFGMAGYKPHLYGGPHAGHFNGFSLTNGITPRRSQTKLSVIVLIC